MPWTYGDLIRKAYLNWTLATRDQWTMNRRMNEFHKLCGTSTFIQRQEVTDEQYQRLELLGGEHGYTYCKMILANETSIEVDEIIGVHREQRTLL